MSMEVVSAAGVLLFRPARGGKVSKGHLMKCWIHSLQRSMGPIDRTQQSDLTRSCVHQAGSELERRAARAEQLAALGELSAGRQDMRTLAALTDPSKRPREPQGPLDEDLLTHQIVVPYTMDMKTFLQNVQSSRRGAAALQG